MTQNAPLLRSSCSILSVGALVIGVIVSLSSCYDDYSYNEPRAYYSAVSILNTTHEAHDLSVYALKAPWLSLPCTTIEQSPQALVRYLSHQETSLFERDPSATFTIHSGQELPLEINKLNASPYDYDYYYEDYYYENNRNNEEPEGDATALCKALLIKSPALGQALVYWPKSMPSKRFYFDLDVPQAIPPDLQTITIKADYSKVPEDEPRHKWRAFDCGHWRMATCDAQTQIEAKQRPRGATYTLESVYDVPLMMPIPHSATGSLAITHSTPDEALLWPPAIEKLFELVTLTPTSVNEDITCAKMQIDRYALKTARTCMPPALMEMLTPSPSRRVFFQQTQDKDELLLIHTTNDNDVLGRWLIKGSGLLTIPHPNTELELPDQQLHIKLDPDLTDAELEQRRCGDLYISHSLLVRADEGPAQLLTSKAPVTLPDKTQLHLLSARRMLARTNRCDLFDPRNSVELELITIKPLSP